MFADDVVICRVELEVPEMKMLRFSLEVRRMERRRRPGGESMAELEVKPE